MDLNKYQEHARRTAIYNKAYSVIYPALGLSGEVGEVCEKIKKMLRDDEINFDYFTMLNIDCDSVLETKREEIKKELGDVLWYIACLAGDFGLKLDDIAQANVDKLRSRAERNVIKGSGDNR